MVHRASLAGDPARGSAVARAPVTFVLEAATRLEPARRVLLWCLLIATILHLPALPTRLMAFLDLLEDAPAEVDEAPLEGESFIPIDLDLEGLRPASDGAPSGEGADAPSGTEAGIFEVPPLQSAPIPPPPPPAPPPPPPPPSAPPPPTPPAAHPPAPVGATPPEPGAEDDPYADAGPPAPIRDPEPVDPTATPDAGPPPLASGSAGPATGPAPIASASTGPAAGPPRPPRAPTLDPDEQTKVTRGLSPAPNVQVLLVGKQLRAHPVGKELGPLLREIPQWRGFFDGTGIDPVADLDHIQITGPELRKSGQIVSVLEFAPPADRIRPAVDAIVKRAKGEWLDGKPFPTARAKVDRAERLFVVLGSRRILAVLPGKDEAKIAALAGVPSYPPDLPFAIQISMVTPHRAFRSIDALKIPSSIRKMRLRAFPHGPGGGKLELEFLDESPAQAAESALVLSDQWKKIQTVALATLLFLDDMTFTVEGDTIVGSTTFTKEQLAKILALARKSFAAPRGAKGDPRRDAR